MPKFLINAEEVRSFSITVEADTLDEALQDLEENSSVYINDDPGEYMDGSFRINEEFTMDSNNVVCSDLGFWDGKKWVSDLYDAKIYHYKPAEFPDAPNVMFVRYVDASI